MPRKPVVIFVHGFGSDELCWNPLVSLLQADDDVSAQFDFERFSYPTKWFNFNPLRRIPRIKELGAALDGFIDSKPFRDREITLVGHSQGGLVIQSFLAEAVRAGRGGSLSNIRQVIFFATPHMGSVLFSPLRKLASMIFTNPQEQSLRVLDNDVNDLRTAITQQIAGATRCDANCWPIPMLCFWGMQDKVVNEASAKAQFQNVAALPGDHFSILKPRDHKDSRYAEFKEALFEPKGHAHVFEIERFDNEVIVEPIDTSKPFNVRHGDKISSVTSDNRAFITRAVTFSEGNRCGDKFRLKYRTQTDGRIEALTSDRNEADEGEIGRYHADGKEIVYEFTHRPPERVYALKITAYKAFDAGQRDIHFHLGQQKVPCYYKSVVCRIDLRPYLKAGFAISQPPQLYAHRVGVDCDKLCKQRMMEHPIPPTRTETTGVYVWELRNLRQGVVHVEWDVTRPKQDPEPDPHTSFLAAERSNLLKDANNRRNPVLAGEAL